MKIVIGTNTFGKYHRQNVAVESWHHLRDTFNCVSLHDVQFRNEPNTCYDIDQMCVLERSSDQYIDDGVKRLPFINDAIEALSTIESDYFVYVNSDVVINTNLIKHIMKKQPNSFACSRVDTYPIKSFQQVLDKKIKQARYEIAGFDVFVFKRDWYLQNKNLFGDYLIGQPHWDQTYATILKIFGGGEPFGNNYPPFCFHERHEMTWQLGMSLEREFNSNCSKRPLDRLLGKIFHDYLDRVLVKRQPYGAFVTPVDNERQLEKEFFNRYI